MTVHVSEKEAHGEPNMEREIMETLDKMKNRLEQLRRSL